MSNKWIFSFYFLCRCKKVWGQNHSARDKHGKCIKYEKLKWSLVCSSLDTVPSPFIKLLYQCLSLYSPPKL